MGRFVKTISLVDICGSLESESRASPRNELPQTRGGRPRKSCRFPSAFDLAKPSHVLRNTLFAKDAASHAHKHTGTVKSDFHRRTSAPLVVVYVLLDHRMYLKGKPK